MNPVIQLQKLTKYYGEHRGVIDLDMEVLPGGVFGYLGPNGAGKTTTIRLLLDLIRPTGAQPGCSASTPRPVPWRYGGALAISPPIPSLYSQSHRRAVSPLRRQPQGRRSLAQYQAPSRQTGVRSFPQHSHPVPRQQAENSRYSRLHARTGASHTGRTHLRPRPPHAARVRAAWSGR